MFFGGGTPSLAHPSTIERVLETVSKHAGLAAGAEVTIEVNPTPAGKSRLEDFQRAGVNRFSIGVQVKCRLLSFFLLSIDSRLKYTLNLPT